MDFGSIYSSVRDALYFLYQITYLSLSKVGITLPERLSEMYSEDHIIYEIRD